ncbi:hypothetical protein EDD22DRAFT_1052331, partial [Suillus occidentalis]
MGQRAAYLVCPICRRLQHSCHHDDKEWSAINLSTGHLEERIYRWYSILVPTSPRLYIHEATAKYKIGHNSPTPLTSLAAVFRPNKTATLGAQVFVSWCCDIYAKLQNRCVQTCLTLDQKPDITWQPRSDHSPVNIQAYYIHCLVLQYLPSDAVTVCSYLLALDHCLYGTLSYTFPCKGLRHRTEKSQFAFGRCRTAASPCLGSGGRILYARIGMPRSAVCNIFCQQAGRREPYVCIEHSLLVLIRRRDALRSGTSAPSDDFRHPICGFPHLNNEILL